MRILLIVGGIFLLVGCTVFESSTYQNRSTPETTVVIATGAAAEAAAQSSTVYNCPSCGGSSSQSPRTTQQRGTSSVTDAVVHRAIEDTGWAISRGISQQINGIFD